MNFVLINPIIELLALTFAIILLSAQKGWWRLFVYYLALVVVVEVLGFIAYKNGNNNSWLFNFYIPLNFGFYFYIFYNICSDFSKKFKPIIVIAYLVWFLIYLVEFLFNGRQVLAFKSIGLGNVICLMLSCCYFFYLLKQENFVRLSKHAPFWLIAGILFHTLGSTMTLIFYEPLKEIYYTYKLPLKQVIYIFLNFIMYSFWIYAFLCRYQSRISSSS